MNLLKITSVLLVLLCLQSASAQVNVGVYGGLNSANLSGDKPSKWQYLSQGVFAGGFVAEMNVSKDVRISFQPGFLQKGTKVGIDIPGERDPKDSLSIKLNYVSLPVLVKIIHDNQRVYLTGGIDFCLLQKASYTEIEDAGQEYDLKENFNSIDIAALLGVGFNVPIKKATLTVEVRYAQGLVNVSKFESRNPARYMPPEFKTKGLQFMAGLLLPIWR